MVPSAFHSLRLGSHRLAWPRTEPSQGSDTGSNPVGTTNTHLTTPAHGFLCGSRVQAKEAIGCFLLNTHLHLVGADSRSFKMKLILW
jgi:hypothetical protein